MAGEVVPLVLLARYTTYSTDAVYTTIAMDVTEYSTAIVNLWRSALVGAGGAVKFNLQESTDQVNWTTCDGTTADFDPGAVTETQYTATLNKRWFRITVQCPNANNVMSCWAVGFLERRLS
jgi:hypothetical protein